MNDEILERIAVALEKMAGMTPEQEVEVPTETQWPLFVPAHIQPLKDRDEIKARLKELGEKFNPKARTYTLKAQLQWAEKQAEAPAETESAPAEIEEEVPAEIEDAPAEVPTAEEVKAKLMDFVRTNGKDRAVAILKKFGAQKLSDISEENRAAFVEQLS